MSDIKVGDTASITVTGKVISIHINSEGTTAVLRYGRIWDEVTVKIEQLQKEEWTSE